MAKFNNIPEISTEHFSFKDRTFTAFASDIFGPLNPNPACPPLVRPTRIYDDACDVGFYMVSEKTGKKILFVESNPVIRDGDLQMYVYSAYCLHENPEHLLDLKIHVFNT